MVAVVVAVVVAVESAAMIISNNNEPIRVGNHCDPQQSMPSLASHGVDGIDIVVGFLLGTYLVF
jgi:hypothetical protein